jgi:hypothetical protein
MSDLYPQKEKKDWSSTIVTLSLITVGTALVVSSCQPHLQSNDDSRRNQYASKQECEADYTATECEPQARSGGGGGFIYLGPHYYGNWRRQGASAFASGGGPGRAALASPNGVVAHPTQTARGGFGATGRSFSSRGS